MIKNSSCNERVAGSSVDWVNLVQELTKSFLKKKKKKKVTSAVVLNCSQVSVSPLAVVTEYWTSTEATMKMVTSGVKSISTCPEQNLPRKLDMGEFKLVLKC